MIAHDIQLVVDLKNRCGEAPVWDPRRRRLIWSDIPADTVHALDPATGRTSIISTGLNASGIALNGEDALVFAGATGLHVVGANGSRRPILTHHDGRALIFNDILGAPGGRLYGGTLYWDAEMEKPGQLYLIEGSGRARVVDDGIELANGLALSPDDRTLYFADSAARRIYAYDVDPGSGSLSRKRAFATFPVEDGIPDGLTTDTQGFVYCAMWYGSQVLRIDAEGRIERRIPIPAIQTSSIALGGNDLTDLYVTSAAEAWPSRLAPADFDPSAKNMGGGVYRVKVDVPGRVEFIAAF